MEVALGGTAYVFYNFLYTVGVGVFGFNTLISCMLAPRLTAPNAKTDWPKLPISPSHAGRHGKASGASGMQLYIISVIQV